MLSGMPATRQRHTRNRSRGSAAFADLITTHRTRHGLSQRDLAEKAGVDRGTVIRWESGDATTPDADSLRAVCRTLGITYLSALIALGNPTVEEVHAWTQVAA